MLLPWTQPRQPTSCKWNKTPRWGDNLQMPTCWPSNLTVKLFLKNCKSLMDDLQVTFLSCIYFLFNFFNLTFQWLILWYLNVLSLCVSFALCLSAFHILCFAHFELCCCWNVQIDLPWRWESRTVLVRCHKTPEFVTAVILLPKLRTIWTDIILKSCWNIGLQ